VRLKTDRQLLV